MIIDWAHYTPLQSFLGGILIGLAALILMTANGRIMGLSGILASLLRGKKEPQLWRIVFLTSTIIAPIIFIFVANQEIEQTMINEGYLLWIGIFLVGFGAALGSGCTSGHGICGLARLQMRSLIAVLCFMGSGFLTTWFILHGNGMG